MKHFEKSLACSVRECVWGRVHNAGQGGGWFGGTQTGDWHIWGKT